MRRIAGANCLLLLAMSAEALLGANLVVYGPRTFTRSTGGPAAVTEDFTVANPTGNFTLVIDNQTVSSASVSLNGVEVVRERDFNQQVKQIIRAVDVKAINQLTVELRGKPGDAMVVRIERLAGAPQIGTLTASPSVIDLNTPSRVVVTAVIADPTVISNDVNLIRLSDSGTQMPLGQLHDDGTNGDLVAGDHVFTVQISLQEQAATEIRLFVSAAFSGQLLRVFSNVITVSVWPARSDSTTGIRFNYPPTWSIQPNSPSLTISNVQQFSVESYQAIASESLFRISLRTNANPGNLAIDAWFDSYFAKAGFDNPPLTRSSIQVNGRSAVRITTQSEIGTMVHIFVPTGPSVIELSHNLNPKFLADYERIISSIRLDDFQTIALNAADLKLLSQAAAATQDPVTVAAGKINSLYELGASGPDKFDCSGLVVYSFNQTGTLLPRVTAAQLATMGTVVNGPAFQRGDLIFFTTPDDAGTGIVGHVGIVEFGTIMIHAASGAGVVKRADFSTDYWQTLYVTARRIETRPILTIQLSGNGHGAVASVPPGITCGNTCSGPFDKDTEVTLSALAASDSKFTGWTGDCAGTNPVVIIIVASDKTCIATFELLPSLTLVNPNSGQQGQTGQNVAISGQFTHFAAGTSAVSFGAGITVGTATVTHVTHSTVQISIDAAAALGGRTVTVTTGPEVVSRANIFTVTAGTPVISLVNPSSGQQGQTGLNVAVTGQFTHFAAGTSAVTFGSGITVGTVTATDATHLTAQISIDASAALGGRTVTVTTGPELVSLANGFTVVEGGNPAVRLNPFGNQTGAGPYNVEVVGSNLVLTPAPQDITVTLLRDVISQCSGLLFSSNRTVVVLQGQSSVAYNFNAGRDPACNTLPITTQYTVTQAVLGASTVLDLSGVPAQQLVLTVTR